MKLPRAHDCLAHGPVHGSEAEQAGAGHGGGRLISGMLAARTGVVLVVPAAVGPLACAEAGVHERQWSLGGQSMTARDPQTEDRELRVGVVVVVCIRFFLG